MREFHKIFNIVYKNKDTKENERKQSNTKIFNPIISIFEGQTTKLLTLNVIHLYFVLGVNTKNDIVYRLITDGKN